MARYEVRIERVERYSHRVTVEAETKAAAERKVREMDISNEFETEWNELPFDVETVYTAEDMKGEQENG